MLSVEARWSEVSLWSAIRIIVFPTTAVMARTVLNTERQMICLSKPGVKSSEQYILARACRVCILFLTQGLKYAESCHLFWPLYYVLVGQVEDINWHTFQYARWLRGINLFWAYLHFYKVLLLVMKFVDSLCVEYLIRVRTSLHLAILITLKCTWQDIVFFHFLLVSKTSRVKLNLARFESKKAQFRPKEIFRFQSVHFTY